MILVHGRALYPAALAPWLEIAAGRGSGALTLVAREGDELLFAVGDGAGAAR